VIRIVYDGIITPVQIDVDEFLKMAETDIKRGEACKLRR
jgi:hypothetical protein